MLHGTISSTHISPCTSPSTSKRVFLETDDNNHWPQQEKKRRRRCIVCQEKGQERRTSIICLKCNVGLCISDCFRIYHCKNI